MAYLLVKTVHVIGAALLLGTGAGIAFFMLMAHLRGDPREVAGVARTVVIADFLFTASAVVLQPVTGIWLAWSTGHSLPAFMQIRMRDLAVAALANAAPLPIQYHRFFWWWFAFGFPAFTAVLGIFWLMIARPPIPYRTKAWAFDIEHTFDFPSPFSARRHADDTQHLIECWIEAQQHHAPYRICGGRQSETK